MRPKDGAIRTGVCAVVVAACCLAQSRTVALTFDDLPAVRATGPEDAERINDSNLAVLKRHKAPAVAFVNERSGMRLGEERWRRMLGKWVRGRHDLGNHTYAHRTLNDLTSAEFEQEVILGEPTAKSVSARGGKPLQFFRFPFDHAGDTRAKFDAAARFIKDRGYRLAPERRLRPVVVESRDRRSDRRRPTAFAIAGHVDRSFAEPVVIAARHALYLLCRGPVESKRNAQVVMDARGSRQVR